MPDSAAYTHDIAKFPDAGLQLNLPVDLVPAGQYSYFTNALSRIEGQVETRDGVSKVCDVGAVSSPIHSIFRLNEVIPGVNGERLFGVTTQLWSAPLPGGNVPVQLTAYTVGGTVFPAFPISFDGTPISMMPFRFDADPQAWVIIANGAKMMKRKANYYEQLGLPAPTAQVIATVGAAGVLTGDYDWRATYVNEVTNSESNPSPIMTAGGTETLVPATNATPAPSVGGATANTITNQGADIGVGSPPHDLTSANWSNFTAASAPYSQLLLQMSYLMALNGPLPGGATYTLVVDYSLDGGGSWQNALTIGPSPGPLSGPGEISVSIPPTTDISLIQVRAYGRVDGGPVAPIYGGSFFVGTGAWTGTNPVELVGTFRDPVPTTLTLANQAANLCVIAPVDPQETAIRIYRRGGSLTDNWYFVNQYPVSSLAQGGCGVGYLEIVDDFADSSIEANPTLELDNDMPVTSVQATNVPLKQIWPFDERVMGVGDPGRPESVYFSKRGNADEWPPENWVVVSEPGTEAMAGFSWNLRAFCFSRERLYTLVLNAIQGVTFTPQETACRRGLKGRFAFCIGEKGVYFISKDGPYRTLGGEEQSIADDFIRPLFPTFDAPGRSVNGYEAIDMDDENGLRLERHNSEVWFDYTGKDSGTRQTLIYDERKGRWRGYTRQSTTTAKAQMHYSEQGTVSRLLTGSVENKVYEGQLLPADDGNAIQVHVRTGARDQGAPLNLKEYGNVVFDLDPGGADNANPIAIVPYVNGDQLAQATLLVTGAAGRIRVPLDLAQVVGELYALNIAFDIAWGTKDGSIAPILYQMDILYRVEPAAMKHWEVPPNSLGFNGFFHVRDSYVTLRSNADVIMKLYPDGGAPITYTIASTAGKKLKVYVPFQPNKVKVVGFAFDSDQEFRIYQPECELRAKQWVTDLGYQVVPLFGAEA